jgi:hypothetical protein
MDYLPRFPKGKKVFNLRPEIRMKTSMQKRLLFWRIAVCWRLFVLCLCGAPLWAMVEHISAAEFEMQAYDRPYSKSLVRADKTRLTVRVDPDNHRAEEVLYSPNQTVLWRLIRELDADYQPFRAIKFDAADQIVSKHKYFWLKGRLEEEEILSPKNVLLARMRYYYDSKGRPEKIEHYNASDVLVSVSRSSGMGVEPLQKNMWEGKRKMQVVGPGSK